MIAGKVFILIELSEPNHREDISAGEFDRA